MTTLNAPELRHNPRFERQALYNAHPKNNLYIVLDRVLDETNIGSCFRIADALSAKEVILTADCSFPHRKLVRKSSVMLSDVVSWSYHKTAVDALYALRTQGIKIVGLELSPRSIDYRKAKFDMSNGAGYAILIGNESRGVSEEALALCDEVVSLPMRGINRSLNVSMALTVLGYKILESLEF